VLMRTAQLSLGWDWGPRLPNVGIWRPVELRHEHRATITGTHCYTLEINRVEDRALVAVRVEAERFAGDTPLTARVRLVDPETGDDVASGQIVLAGEGDHLAATTYLAAERPRLWWTHDLGEPFLYNVEIVLSEDGDELDRCTQPVGIRTIKLDQFPDPAEPGTRFFRFVLNDVPIFAKGANWIPADSFFGALTANRYEMLLTAARDANMNMLRIWGGGIYEQDVFYDLCDRLGLLIWQDFMFSCAMYPENNADFVAEVEAEARYQVRRLRSHPCLALWCGNNENQWLHDRANWEVAVARVPGALYYDDILPQVVAELDGQIPYWPGSPYGGNDHNSMFDGDRHNWDVWHGNSPRRFGEKPRNENTPESVSFVRYAQDMGRFISEFGMHAAPVYETLRRSIPADQLYHHSPAMDHHNKDNPKNKGDNLMLVATDLPDDLEEYIDFSMIAQAEGLKFGIEHFRRRKPHCSGTLFWQFNDCWPVLSWSVLDYYGFGKASYFYTTRVYAPVMASFKQLADGAVELWVVNDTLDRVSDTITVRLGTFDGAIIWEQETPIEVGANTSTQLMRWDASQIAGGPDRYLSVQAAGDLFPANRHFFGMIKDLQRDPRPPEVTIRQVDDHTLAVDLQAATYAFFVHVIVPDEATRFSDNYFDLEPGETRTITVRNAARRIMPEMVTVRSR
jgi:beta-mannosidase